MRDFMDLCDLPWPLPVEPGPTPPREPTGTARSEDDAEVLEVLAWHRADQRWPDSDATVLCWGADGIFTGYWDDAAQQWLDCASGGVCEVAPSHWCEPAGPA